MDPSLLEELGLTPAEARLYLTMLQAGPSKTGVLIRLSKLQSSTVYNALQGLIQKGLASFVMVGKTKQFGAQHPESFLTFIQERQKRFEDILPELKKLENRGAPSRGARVYEGMRGLRAAYDDVLATMKPGEEYYFFQVASERIGQEHVRRFFAHYHLTRSSLGINVKGMALIDARESMKDIYNLPHTQVRFVSEFLPTGLVVYKDKLMTIDWSEKEPVAIIIQGKGVADSYRRFFDEKWKTAKKA